MDKMEQINLDNLGKDDETQETEINYEDAMKELEQIVAKLERGESDLDESMKLFERGIALANYCDRKLTQMEEKIKVLSVDAQGEAVEEDMTSDFGFDL